MKLVFVISTRSHQALFDEVLRNFPLKNHKIIWFKKNNLYLKQRVSRHKDSIKLIPTSPWSVRTYAYQFICYLRVMYTVKSKMVVVSDNFSDMVLLNYDKNLEFFYARKQLKNIIELRKLSQGGIIPFDCDIFSYDRIAKECSELYNEIMKNRR